MYPPTVQSSSLSHPPAPGHSARRRSEAPPPTGNPRRPSRGPLPGMGVPANWRLSPPQRAAATNRRIPMSRPPTGESAPAEHNGLAPAGSPLPSRHPALPDP
ncbi:hypothetical protein N7509_000487 [Penicillium cosmopolitanum]|uniref:Uncharacterized protein n=1 Tax=Penicillium cosmopolitanum TaxID=1131564 RepID=A0A9W9WAD4_9EURO|nr:uncharacterized protein N7509_000474 [Penicillium cosmopolitanum]XP_056493703.1 uncharacterized protein N7509_000479 [Penicillium cosmopolitanum]XP_056493705.1 uncharacterized protein N7509_000483 [Penicillium cosmopolitanum]XP_056493707.1 uncharacterized protein N7509_000487 [Penicillium cosmopolitanum]KAJ5413847.1 hypothetical protein N7509_000474 [Penicillium cosmopolitanum]KAJ5413852.1 hypothetical protein N7509_000479 [Penicillium cosmopolitanum]KAJ5413856.1 hypothetical protein N7509